MRRIKLCKGAGNGIDAACLMTASNMLMGHPERGDMNPCVCTLLQAFITWTNDAMPDDVRERLYGPLVWEILGTANNDPIVMRARVVKFTEYCPMIRGGLSNPIYWHMLVHNTAIYLSNNKRWEDCVKVIREVAAIGDKRPVECVMTVDQLAEALK